MVGWYSTGPRLREADLDITALLGNYCDTPLLVICEVQVRGFAPLASTAPHAQAPLAQHAIESTVRHLLLFMP